MIATADEYHPMNGGELIVFKRIGGAAS
jgi:hypothetical protein